MACSGFNDDRWCIELPTHYKDGEGNEYCIFHTPRSFKGEVSPETFNSIVFDKIRKDIKERGCINLSGTVFDWDIDFSYLAAEGPFINADFSGAIFYGDVHFKKAVFNEKTSFAGTTFCEITEFYKTLFNGPCSFKNAVFKGKPFFFDTLFEDKVDFSDAFFHRGVFFTWGGFKQGALFKGTKYGMNVTFKRPIAA